MQWGVGTDFNVTVPKRHVIEAKLLDTARSLAFLCYHQVEYINE